jgi:hypothetical protein
MACWLRGGLYRIPRLSRRNHWQPLQIDRSFLQEQHSGKKREDECSRSESGKQGFAEPEFNCSRKVRCRIRAHASARSQATQVREDGPAGVGPQRFELQKEPLRPRVVPEAILPAWRGREEVLLPRLESRISELRWAYVQEKRRPKVGAEKLLLRTGSLYHKDWKLGVDRDRGKILRSRRFVGALCA